MAAEVAPALSGAHSLSRLDEDARCCLLIGWLLGWYSQHELLAPRRGPLPAPWAFWANKWQCRAVNSDHTKRCPERIMDVHNQTVVLLKAPQICIAFLYHFAGTLYTKHCVHTSWTIILVLSKDRESDLWVNLSCILWKKELLVDFLLLNVSR